MDFKEPSSKCIMQYGSFNSYSLTFPHFVRFIIFNLFCFINLQQERATYTSLIWENLLLGNGWCLSYSYSSCFFFKLNVFLLLIAIFSFYLAFAGMRFAVNRKGIPKLIDWIAVILMFFSGIAMVILGLKYYFNDDTPICNPVNFWINRLVFII